MTYEELKTSKKEFLSPKDIAPIIGCAPYSINICAREAPERLGFPVMFIKARVRIPRRAFLRFIEGKGPEEEAG